MVIHFNYPPFSLINHDTQLMSMERFPEKPQQLKKVPKLTVSDSEEALCTVVSSHSSLFDWSCHIFLMRTICNSLGKRQNCSATNESHALSLSL